MSVSGGGGVGGVGSGMMGGGGEKSDNGDSNDGNIVGSRGSGDGGLCGDGSGGGGGNIMRHATRNPNQSEFHYVVGNTSTSNNDDGMTIGGNVSYRKAATDSGLRHSRPHGIRKLQKCLSTTISNYEGEGSSSGSFSASHVFHPQSSLDIRNLTTTTPQASLTSQSILTSVRQYSSFGSTTSQNYLQTKKPLDLQGKKGIAKKKIFFCVLSLLSLYES